MAIYEAELSKNCENEASTRCSLKNNMDMTACKILLDDVFPGILKKMVRRWSVSLPVYAERAMIFKVYMDWLQFLARKFITILNCYLDLVKDLYLFLIVVLAVGGFRSLYDFPTKLGCILAFVLFGSILLPIICSSLVLAFQRIKDEEKVVKKKINTCRITVIVAYTLLMSMKNPIGTFKIFITFKSSVLS